MGSGRSGCEQAAYETSSWPCSRRKEEPKASSLAGSSRNKRWKGQAVQTDQEQRSCKRQEEPSPGMNFLREQEQADSCREHHQSHEHNTEKRAAPIPLEVPGSEAQQHDDGNAQKQHQPRHDGGKAGDDILHHGSPERQRICAREHTYSIPEMGTGSQ